MTDAPLTVANRRGDATILDRPAALVVMVARGRGEAVIRDRADTDETPVTIGETGA